MHFEIIGSRAHDNHETTLLIDAADQAQAIARAHEAKVMVRRIRVVGVAPDNSSENHKLCIDCHYVLDGLRTTRCPECGRAFDPAAPATWVTSSSVLPPPSPASIVFFLIASVSGVVITIVFDAPILGISLFVVASIVQHVSIRPPRSQESQR